MSAAAMTCSEVRERLGELSLGIVPAEEARRIEWHLQSCAGCRKEQAELQEGAATLAFSLPPADPPPSLEHRVIDRVAQASGRRVPAQARRQLRTQVRRLASVAVAAAILASLSVGWAVSERNRAGDVQRVTELQAQRLPREVAKLIDSLGRPAVEVALSPTPGRQGTGTATIVSVPRQDDFILVTAYLVEPMLRVTLVPTVASASVKENVIPSRAEVLVDCRVPPGMGRTEALEHAQAVLGEAAEGLELEFTDTVVGNRSSADSPLATAIEEWLGEADPPATLVPIVMAGFSDSHWFREAFDSAVVYGFCPQREMALPEAAPLIHGADERVAVADIDLAARFYLDIVRDVLG